MLYKALRDGDAVVLAAVARLAVARYSAMEPGRPVGGTYYLYRTLRSLDLDGVLARLVAEARVMAGTPVGAGVEEGPGGDVLRGRRPGQLTGLEERLLEDEYHARIEELKKEIEAEIRRRLVADRGADALARSVRKPLPEDVDFMHATREELVAMRNAIQPLTRKLATRLARKRRHLRRGSLDFRSTMRHSLSYGGVPVEPRFKHPRPAKPEIWVIADISGSVAAFARFTLHLVHAISSQFSKVRSFVFIDGIDEVTGIFDRSETVTEAVHRVNVEADVVWVDGHSDYGHALTVFYERWGDEIGPKASMLEGKTVLAIGPGIGTVPETAELVRTLVNSRRLPVVLDADGLNAFAGGMDKFQSGGDLADAILTPHPGEMGRLAGLSTAEIQAHRVEIAREFARKHQVNLVLKGFRTLTAAPDGQIWVNPTGNPGMATGGTGDVLTGMTAGLVAQYRNRPINEVAAAAVFLHGLAGDLAAKEMGQASLIAGDLIGRVATGVQASDK